MSPKKKRKTRKARSHSTKARQRPKFVDGFNDNGLGVLYYVAFDNCYGATLYKIGITGYSVSKRFEKDLRKPRLLMEKRYGIGLLARDEETRILQKYKKWRYRGPRVLKSGNTELFTRDVLGLDSDRVN